MEKKISSSSCPILLWSWKQIDANVKNDFSSNESFITITISSYQRNVFLDENFHRLIFLQKKKKRNRKATNFAWRPSFKKVRCFRWTFYGLKTFRFCSKRMVRWWERKKELTGYVGEKERERVSVCEIVWKRVVRVICVIECVWKREIPCLCVCVREKERERLWRREHVCVCVWVRYGENKEDKGACREVRE